MVNRDGFTIGVFMGCTGHTGTVVPLAKIISELQSGYPKNVRK